MAKHGIIMKCVETGEETYITKKNKKNSPDKLELKKYNPKVRRHTIFKEKK